MAATQLPLQKLNYNSGFTAARANNTASPTTAGSTWVVGSSAGLENYSEMFLLVDTNGSSAGATLTAYASTWGTAGSRGDLSVTLDSTYPVGSTNAVKIVGPFASARFRTTGGGVDGLHFNIAASSGTATVARVEAFGLPGAYSTYGP